MRQNKTKKRCYHTFLRHCIGMVFIVLCDQISSIDGFLSHNVPIIPSYPCPKQNHHQYYPNTQWTPTSILQPDLSSQPSLSSPSSKRTHVSPLRSSLLQSSSIVAGSAVTRGIGSYYLIRILFLRGLGVVYLTAFLVALHQNKALIGYNGIAPAHYILNEAEQRSITSERHTPICNIHMLHPREVQESALLLLPPSLKNSPR